MMRPGIICCVLLVIAGGCSRKPAEEASEIPLQDETPTADELSLGFSDEGTDQPQASAPAIPYTADRPEKVSLPGEDAEIEEHFSVIKELTREAMFTEAWQLARDFRAENPDHPQVAEMDQIINRLNRLRRDAPGITYAISHISDPNPTVRDVVHRQLIQGGETAAIMLRKALRDAQNPAVSLLAAELLLRKGDTDSLDDFLIRIDRDEHAAEELTIIDIAAEMLPEQEDHKALQQAAALLKKYNSAAFIPLAEGIFNAVRSDEAKAATDAAATAADYLRRMAGMSDDTALLTKIARAAAASEDAELIRGFMVPGDPRQATGEVHAYSKSHNNFPAVNAFENDDRWLPEQSALPAVFVTYKFTDGYAYMVDKYRIMTQHHNYEGRSPVDFTLQGSDDGTGWTIVDTVRGEADWGADEWREFEVDNPGLYQYYKLVIEKFSGDQTHGGIRHIEYHGQWRQPR